jgi:hypothetical protein
MAGGDDGYTLSDTLAGLLMISLAMLGLSQAVHVTMKLQRKSSEADASSGGARRAEMVMERVLTPLTPFGFGDRTLSGDARALIATTPKLSTPARIALQAVSNGSRLTFGPGIGEGDILLGAVHESAFRYVDADGLRHSRWPEGEKPLIGIAIVNSAHSDSPVAWIPLRRQQSTTCAFDPASGGCVEPRL